MTRVRPVLPAALASAALALLLLRPAMLRDPALGAPAVVAMFVLLALVSLAVPLPAEPAVSRRVWVAVLLAGMAAFAAGRLIGSGAPVVPLTTGVVLLNTLAAVSEELVFRRLLYGLLTPYGVLPAAVVSAAAFALIHAPLYGGWVVPIDFGAGLLLAWQRTASRSVTVPALTHVAANVMAVL